MGLDPRSNGVDETTVAVMRFPAGRLLEGAEPEPSGEEGLADLRVLVALQESARTGRPIALGPFERTRRPDPAQVIVRPPVEKPSATVRPPRWR